MENAVLKINHKVVHKRANTVLAPIHVVALTPNRTVVQGYGRMDTQTPQQ